MDDDIFEQQLQTRYLILRILLGTLENSLSTAEDDLQFYTKYNYSKEALQTQNRREKIKQEISHYHKKLHQMFPI